MCFCNIERRNRLTGYKSKHSDGAKKSHLKKKCLMFMGAEWEKIAFQFHVKV